MGAIDRSLLPQRACVDTVVLVLGLDETSTDPRAPSCKAFLDGMQDSGGRILIAAPTIAEYLRDGTRKSLPRIRGIETVPFDEVAADLLARQLPAAVIKQVHQESGLAYDYIKYDAMIVACALRHRADHFVTLDRRQTGLATRVGLKTFRPSDYEQRQQSLALPSPPQPDTPKVPEPQKPPEPSGVARPTPWFVRVPRKTES